MSLHYIIMKIFSDLGLQDSNKKMCREHKMQQITGSIINTNSLSTAATTIMNSATTILLHRNCQLQTLYSVMVHYIT